MILIVNDWNLKGTGYSWIARGIATELSKYDKVVGLGADYDGSEHYHPFNIVQSSFNEIPFQLRALCNDPQVSKDIRAVIYVSDIPVIMRQLEKYRPQVPLVGIFAVEGQPMSDTWAMALGSLAQRYTISEFGQKVCQEATLPSEHLLIPPGDVYKSLNRVKIRRNDVRLKYGISPDEYLVITVADNQERKNLPVAIHAFAKFAQEIPEACARYLIVTRQRKFGYSLYDLVKSAGLKKRNQITDYMIDNIHMEQVIIIEKGIPDQDLAELYASADVLLLTSKAEGLCLPIREAQACGLLCIAPDSTAMTEQLTDRRGILIPIAFGGEELVDPFGNCQRHLVTIKDTCESLKIAYQMSIEEKISIIERAQAHVRGMEWQKSIENLLKRLFSQQELHSPDQALNQFQYST